MAFVGVVQKVTTATAEHLEFVRATDRTPRARRRGRRGRRASALAVGIEQRAAFVLAVEVDQPVPSVCKVATVTGKPLTCDDPRPMAEIRRVRITWPSSRTPPRIASTSSRSRVPRHQTPPPRLRTSPNEPNPPRPCRPSTSVNAASKRLFPRRFRRSRRNSRATTRPGRLRSTRGSGPRVREARRGRLRAERTKGGNSPH